MPAARRRGAWHGSRSGGGRREAGDRTPVPSGSRPPGAGPPRIAARKRGGYNGRSRGDVAQLGERRVRNAKVEGSIPFVSTIHTDRPLIVRKITALKAFVLGRGVCVDGTVIRHAGQTYDRNSARWPRRGVAHRFFGSGRWRGAFRPNRRQALAAAPYFAGSMAVTVFGRLPRSIGSHVARGHGSPLLR